MKWERRFLDIFAEDVSQWLTTAKAVQAANRIDLAKTGRDSAVSARVLANAILLTLDPQIDNADFGRFEKWLAEAKKLEAWFNVTFEYTRRVDGAVEVVHKSDPTIRHIDNGKSGSTIPKLNNVQRGELMEMIKSGESFTQIAQAYGVSTSTVGYYAGKVRKLNGSTEK